MSDEQEYEQRPFRSRNSRMHEKPRGRFSFGRRSHNKDHKKPKIVENVALDQSETISPVDVKPIVNQDMPKYNVEHSAVKIRAEHVSKRFEMLQTRSDKLKALFNFRQRNQNYFWSLRDVSFEVLEGQTVAIVGLNGSGKSTLLKAVSGFIPITTGSLDVNGAVSEISVNAGLRTNLSGRDNIYLRMYMSGFTKKQVNERIGEIIEFSELGKFIDQPVKSYSSGMRSKLGFSIMIQTDPDIMIIDEALSVGDSTFAAKSFAKIKEFKERGKTIFFVSHSDSQVAQIADKVIWMHYGQLIEFGDTKVVLSKYQRWQRNFAKKPKASRRLYMQNAKRKQAQFDPTMASADTDTPLVNLDLSPKEQRRAFLFGTARSNLDQIHFGVVNWAIVGGLIGLFMAVSLYSIQVASQTRNAAEIENAKILKKRELDKQKRSDQDRKKDAVESSMDSMIAPSVDDTPAYVAPTVPAVTPSVSSSSSQAVVPTPVTPPANDSNNSQPPVDNSNSDSGTNSDGDNMDSGAASPTDGNNLEH